MNSSVRVRVRDINQAATFPSDLTIGCTAVPTVGHVLNLYEILPPDELGEEGWWYIVERVEWSLEEGEGSKVYEPVVTVRRELKKDQP
jgi:hypothetical protein